MAKGKIIVDGNTLRGQLATYHVFLRFTLVPNAERRGDNSPTHKINGIGAAGHNFDAGVSWERQIKQGERAGKSFFVLCLDDPVFGDNPVYFNAWPDDKGGLYIEAERKKQPDSNAAQSQNDQSDNIPF